MNAPVTYSIVVPVYNSAQSLPELCKRIGATLSDMHYELILVDDGSTDGSWQVITQQKSLNSSIKAIRLQKNYGQHAAQLCAFNYCKGSFIITIDDDLQFDPEDILLLVQKQEETGADVVYGVMVDKHHSAVRNIGSSYVKRSSRMAGNNEGEGSSFRLITKSIITPIVANHRHNFLFIDEVLQWYTSSFAYVLVSHHPRQHGRSGYSLPRLIKLYFNIVTNYSAFPLKLMTYLGLIFSVIFFCTGVIFLHRKLVYNVPLGYTSIIVTIFFSASVIMLCLGIIAQYLFKMYLSQQNKPVYTIKQII